jgi:transcriptional regulator with XRE-family HTH domain
MITAEQIRAARALARLDQSELAERAGISVETVKRVERLRGPISANTSTEAAIRRVFAAMGIDFIDENGGGYGVRFRNPGHVLANDKMKTDADDAAAVGALQSPSKD